MEGPPPSWHSLLAVWLDDSKQQSKEPGAVRVWLWATARPARSLISKVVHVVHLALFQKYCGGRESLLYQLPFAVAVTLKTGSGSGVGREGREGREEK